jgi:hypothetical protein
MEIRSGDLGTSSAGCSVVKATRPLKLRCLSSSLVPWKSAPVRLASKNDSTKKPIVDSVVAVAEKLNISESDNYNDDWNEVYKLERMLSLAQPTNTLIGEIQRRIDEASEDKIPTTQRL